MITAYCDSKGFDNKGGGPDRWGGITGVALTREGLQIVFFSITNSKTAVLRPTPEPGNDSKYPRLAAIPDNVNGGN